MTYSHRNGETEPPTEADRYWFDGFRIKHNGNRAHIRDIVTTDDNGNVYNDVDGEMNPVATYEGRWWGPIVPPWAE